MTDKTRFILTFFSEYANIASFTQYDNLLLLLNAYLLFYNIEGLYVNGVKID